MFCTNLKNTRQVFNCGNPTIIADNDQQKYYVLFSKKKYLCSKYGFSWYTVAYCISTADNDSEIYVLYYDENKFQWNFLDMETDSSKETDDFISKHTNQIEDYQFYRVLF